MVKRDAMTNRAFKVNDDLWNDAVKKATEAPEEPRRLTVLLDGTENVSEILRKCLAAFVR